MSRDRTGAGLAWIGGSVLAAMLVALPARADAQHGEDLFREGIALREAGDTDGAIERLRRAHGIDPEPRVVYNLAAALADRGHYVEARFLLRRLVGSGDANLLIRDAAHELLERVAPQIATVRVHVEGVRPGQRVVVDGARAVEDGQEISLDPGAHRIEVRAPSGAVLARSQIDLGPGVRTEVVLRPVSTLAREPSRAGRTAPEGAVSLEASSEGDDAWLWIGISAGVVLVLAAVVTASAIALSSQDGAIAGDLEDVHVGDAP